MGAGQEQQILLPTSIQIEHITRLKAGKLARSRLWENTKK